MALTVQSAADKDRRTAKHGVTLQHRHFAFIAATLRKAKPINANGGLAPSGLGTWAYIVNAFADECKATNPHFDVARFTTACGLFE